MFLFLSWIFRIPFTFCSQILYVSLQNQNNVTGGENPSGYCKLLYSFNMSEKDECFLLNIHFAFNLNILRIQICIFWMFESILWRIHKSNFCNGNFKKQEATKNIFLECNNAQFKFRIWIRLNRKKIWFSAKSLH